MIKILAISAAALLFFSCQKTGFHREQVRITQTRYSVGADSAEYMEFGYDPSGRVDQVKIGININKGGSGYTASITYNGNQAVIRTAPVDNGNIYSSTTIYYTLNGAVLPVTRIQLDTFLVRELYYPIQPQHSYKADTASYQYDAEGLLLKVTGNTRDSTWFNPGLPQTQTSFGQYVTDYTNVGRNISQIVRTGSVQFRNIMSGGTVSIPLHMVSMDKWTYQYQHGYFNLADFNNVFVMMEYGAILLGDLPLNKGYKNLPDKITQQSIVYDQQGSPLSDNKYEYDFSFSYFPDGFISAVTRSQFPPAGLSLEPTRTYLSYKK